MFTFTKEQKKLLGDFYTFNSTPRTYGDAAKWDDKMMHEVNLLSRNGEEYASQKFFKQFLRIDRHQFHYDYSSINLIPGLINNWEIVDDDGTHWTQVMIIEGDDPETIWERLKSLGFEVEGTQGSVAPGAAFLHGTSVYRYTQDRCIAFHSGGLNV